MLLKVPKELQGSLMMFSVATSRIRSIVQIRGEFPTMNICTFERSRSICVLRCLLSGDIAGFLRICGPEIVRNRLGDDRLAAIGMDMDDASPGIGGPERSVRFCQNTFRPLKVFTNILDSIQVYRKIFKL